jgi:hypothetical protein
MKSSALLALNEKHICYGSFSSLFGHLVGVGLPALVGLPGGVLVAAVAKAAHKYSGA